MVTLILRPLHTANASSPQFSVDLLDGSCAMVSMVTDRICSVSVHRSGHPPTERGLFGTTQDAIELLRAEVTARIVAAAAQPLARQAPVTERTAAPPPLSLADEQATVDRIVAMLKGPSVTGTQGAIKTTARSQTGR